MKVKTLWSVAAAGVCLAMSGQAVHAAGDWDEGRKKFYTCAGCHSISGYSNAFPTYPVPRLGGQNAAFLISALKDYKSGARTHGSMEGNANGISEQDMADLAAFVSRKRLVTENNPISGNVAAGKGKAESCGACHGADGKSEDANYPTLAGQYEGYLIKAMKDYKSGARKNPIMASMVGNLSDRDLQDIAAYYASQPRGLTTIEE